MITYNTVEERGCAYSLLLGNEDMSHYIVESKVEPGKPGYTKIGVRIVEPGDEQVGRELIGILNDVGGIERPFKPAFEGAVPVLHGNQFATYYADTQDKYREICVYAPDELLEKARQHVLGKVPVKDEDKQEPWETLPLWEILCAAGFVDSTSLDKAQFLKNSPFFTHELTWGEHTAMFHLTKAIIAVRDASRGEDEAQHNPLNDTVVLKIAHELVEPDGGSVDEIGRRRDGLIRCIDQAVREKGVVLNQRVAVKRALGERYDAYICGTRPTKKGELPDIRIYVDGLPDHTTIVDAQTVAVQDSLLPQYHYARKPAPAGAKKEMVEIPITWNGSREEQYANARYILEGLRAYTPDVDKALHQAFDDLYAPMDLGGMMNRDREAQECQERTTALWQKRATEANQKASVAGRA